MLNATVSLNSCLRRCITRFGCHENSRKCISVGQPVRHSQGRDDEPLGQHYPFIGPNHLGDKDPLL